MKLITINEVVKVDDLVPSIIYVLEYYYYFNVDDDSESEFLEHFKKFEFLKKDSLKWIKKHGNRLYRGLKTVDKPHGNYPIQSWTIDAATAKAFATNKGKVLETNDFSMVIFAMDVFVDYVSKSVELIDDTDAKNIINLLNKYVSESEVICYNN